MSRLIFMSSFPNQTIAEFIFFSLLQINVYFILKAKKEKHEKIKYLT